MRKVKNLRKIKKYDLLGWKEDCCLKVRDRMNETMRALSFYSCSYYLNRIFFFFFTTKTVTKWLTSGVWQRSVNQSANVKLWKIMPDKASGNRYGSRDSDFCSEEISSIGMSIRPSGSASSGEFIHNSYWSQKFTYLCIFQIYLLILKTLPILFYFIFSFKHISLLIFKYIFCPYRPGANRGRGWKRVAPTGEFSTSGPPLSMGKNFHGGYRVSFFAAKRVALHDLHLAYNRKFIFDF